MSDIQISTETLRAATADARGVADAVRLARDAAGAALPGDAFGLMCSPLFLPLYLPVKATAENLMESCAQALERSAQGLSDVASDFEQHEDSLSHAFDALGRNL